MLAREVGKDLTNNKKGFAKKDELLENVHDDDAHRDNVQMKNHKQAYL